MSLPAADSFSTLNQREALRLEASAYVARARTMMARARALVEADRVDAIALLTLRRAGLACHFQRYQRFKHGRIFDPVVARGLSSSALVARSMKVDCLQLGEVFGGYHARWRALRPTSWDAYRRDMLATTTMLGEHLDAELRAIGQLLAIAAFYDRAA